MSKITLRKCSGIQKIRGVAIVEYILGLSVLVVALAVPTPLYKDDSGKNISVVQLLELVLKKEYATYSESISEAR